MDVHKQNSNYIEDTVCKKVSLLFLPMAMSAVSTVRTIAQSLGKGGAQPQGGAELHTQALVMVMLVMLVVVVVVVIINL